MKEKDFELETQTIREAERQCGQVRFSREWAMPSGDTFDVEPIARFVGRYLKRSQVSVDPFARNKRWATYTNDLNPDTKAEYHMTALEFLKMLKADGIRADIVIFDPPYSIHQAKVCYESFGAKTFTQYDAQNVVRWTDEKDVARDLLSENGTFLQFGWNSSGLGRKFGFELIELLLVCHGPAHNDTICLAEKRMACPRDLFNSPNGRGFQSQRCFQHSNHAARGIG